MVGRAARCGRAVGRRLRSRRRHAGRDAAVRRAGRAGRRGSWPRVAAVRAVRGGRRPARRTARRVRGSRAPRARARDLRRSPSRTGCARRRRSSGRSGSPTNFWIVPTWARGAAIPDALNLRLDPGPRLRHGLASDDAPVPRVAARRTSRAASRCSTTAAARASWRSPARSWAPGAWSAPTSIRRPCARARTMRARTASRRRSSFPMRCRRDASTSSSPTSWPIR